MPETRRQRLELLRARLDTERASFIPHWRDLNDFILPRRGRFFLSDANKGDRRTQKIIDSTATYAARTLASGMMSGVTSPARPWFRLTTPDPDLAEFGTVKAWLHDVQQRMITVFLRSNVYNRLPTLYQDLGVFGTGAVALMEDDEAVIRMFDFPIGSYMLANDERLRVRVFMREYRMTVRQLVRQFGRLDAKGKPDWSRFSPTVKNHWERGQYEEWIDVVHAIVPNDEWNPRLLGARFKRFRSVYYERGSDQDRYLEDSGFDEFPIFAPRWETTGEDVYGTNSPGMTALGDVKQLQQGEKRAAQAIDKMVNPPMVGPEALRAQRASILPGDITYVDEASGRGGFKPAHEVNLRVDLLEQKQEQVRWRVRRSFYEDLFLMLANSDRREITAREIDERHEEKLLALGPVLEQLNQDLLDPLIDRTFAIMLRRELLPPPPPELEGMELQVEYVSIMAQAQRMVGLSALDRFTDRVVTLAGVDPTVLDTVDRDEIVEEYATITGVAPSIVRSQEQVDAIRQQRAQAAAQQAAAEQAAQLAPAAKQLSETQTGGQNLLSELLGAGGPGGPL